MDSKSYIITYVWNPEELRVASKFHYQSAFRTFFTILRVLLGLALLAMAAGIFLMPKTSDHSLTISWAIVIGLTVLGISTIFYNPLSRRKMARAFRGLPYEEVDLTITLDDEGCHHSSEFEESHQKWKNFVKAKMGEEGILLYTAPHFFYWIPGHGFGSAEDFGEARVFVSGKVDKVLVI